ncbi:MAG: hydroxymethylglutaryl-CoA lyase [Nocardioidaceae bacterium]|nr:hydroxymethylglutaryl-CoA lyase [Nocardioidaceae bacterium]
MKRTPQVVPQAGLPSRVTIYEVGPRDGLQNEQAILPVDVKAEFIHRLVGAGLEAIEVTSLVHPRWVPQLADAEDLLAAVDLGAAARMPVLVPNERGLDRALAAGVREIAIFGSATQTFARRNLNRSLDEQYAMFAPVVSRARAEGLAVRGYLSMCFGDPWEGDVAVDQVVSAGRRLFGLGCSELSLGDTIGVATPGHVEAVLGGFIAAGLTMSQLAVHFHDTYGQALSNALTAIRLGVTTFDASAGGLGGCPYAESATGNLATEDLVWQLHGLGIDTGVDLERLVETSAWMAGKIGKAPVSRVATALT